ncbi:MAG: hypothetical protein HFG10_11455, partial [Oscillibacter sp.]|nr:hypothetical protein [Oscillibacter sp.]
DGDIPIINLDDFLSSKEGAKDCWFVISAPSAEKAIRETLAGHFPQDRIFSFETMLYVVYFSLQDVEPYRTYLVEHWDEFSRLYDTLADDQSSNPHLCIERETERGLGPFSEMLCS